LKHRIVWMVCVWVICIAVMGDAAGQSQTNANRLEFEVASVKPGTPGAGYGLPGPMPGGQTYAATNSPLMVMLMKAYRITDSQILGAPKWMIFDPWNVNAKAEHPSSLRQLEEMFQALLADRFKLRFHRETREAGAYVLSVEKSGSRLKRSDARGPSDTPIKAGDRPGERVGTGASMSDLC
jgi:uncharacterized protein (TIGR03435 family)